MQAGIATPLTPPTMTTNDATLLRLLTWLSPAYPIGAYSYSHGLEAAVEAGLVAHRDDLVGYVAQALAHGAGVVDGAVLAACHRAAASGDAAALDTAAELAHAFRGTAETALESAAQGAAFAAVTAVAWPDPRFAAFVARHSRRLAHAAAFGAACGYQGVALRSALLGHLAAFAANLVSAGVRLVPLGQTDGQRATAALGPCVVAAAAAAEGAALDEIGTASPMLDLLSIRHETQYTRLFRS